MPIYEYECANCKHQFDFMQKTNEEPLRVCPNCSQNALVKLVSAAGFQLKGTGWYATDFKNKGAPPDKKKANVAESNASEASKGPSKTSTETK